MLLHINYHRSSPLSPRRFPPHLTLQQRDAGEEVPTVVARHSKHFEGGTPCPRLPASLPSEVCETFDALAGALPHACRPCSVAPSPRMSRRPVRQPPFDGRRPLPSDYLRAADAPTLAKLSEVHTAIVATRVSASDGGGAPDRRWLVVQRFDTERGPAR